MTTRCLALSIAALALTACASTPPQYYTLLSPAAVASTLASNAFQIEVLPVDIPAQVESPQMVIRSAAGEMSKAEGHRWIAPLDAEIRGALSADLSQQLGARDVYGLTYGNTLKTYRVALKVQRFDSAPGAYARIDAVWTVTALDQPKAISACSSSVSQTIGAGYDALALGHQQALATIAAQIARSISALQAGRAAPVCPGG